VPPFLPEPTAPRRRRRGPTPRALPALTAAALLASALLSACISTRTAPPPDPLASLARAEHLLATGDVAGAAAAYEEHLAAGDGVAGGDLALMRLALLRLQADGPLRDPAAGIGLLRRLLEVHPQSPYATAALLILHLRRDNRRLDAEVVRLRRQLDELRSIDLGPGEKDPR
jgi:hypothetical protein